MKWEMRKLGEVCEIYGGSTPSRRTDEFWNSNDVPWFTISDIRDQGRIVSTTKQYVSNEAVLKTSLKVWPTNTIAVCCTASLGAVAKLTIESASNQQFNGLKAKDSKQLDPDYLLYFCETLTPTLFSLSGKATIDFVSRKKLSTISIPVPPLSVQREIVERLDAAFGLIDRARANVERCVVLAGELWEGVLEEIYREALTSGQQVCLEDVAASDCTLSYGIVQPGKERDTGMLLVRPVDLKEIIVSEEGLKRIDPIKAKGYDRTTLQGGELLLCVRGDTGRHAMASEGLKGANVTRGLVPIRFTECVDYEYARYFFMSPLLQSAIQDKTYGSTLQQINIRDVRKLPFVLVSSEEQGRIREQASKVEAHTDSLNRLYMAQLSSLETLQSAMLAQAFTEDSVI